jgi:hypothetical protein
MNLIPRIRAEKISPLKNPSKTQQNWFELNRNNFFLGNPYPTYTLKQKEFTRPRPEREYRRFIETKQALSGMDPSGKIQEFINKDIIRPLVRPSLYDHFDIKNPNYIHNDLYKTRPNNNSKWAINTACRAPNLETLPKVQPYQTYYFPPKYNNKDIEKYRAFSLKSDHIGIKVPRIRKIESKDSFLKLKKDYSVSSETKKENKWYPYPSKDSLKTLSSKNYDIINFIPILPYNSNCQIMNKTLNYRKKGVGEFSDLSKTFRVNVNKDFKEKFEENPKRFYKYTGIFSNMYDASHKNGNIITPFGQKNKLTNGITK